MRSFSKIANRVAASQEELPDVIGTGLSGNTEYSANIELNISVTFEGNASKEILLQKIRDELKSAISTGLQVVSNDLGLSSVEAHVRPIKLDVAVLDDVGFEGSSSEDETATDSDDVEEASVEEPAGDVEGTTEASEFEESTEPEDDDTPSESDEESGSSEPDDFDAMFEELTEGSEVEPEEAPESSGSAEEESD